MDDDKECLYAASPQASEKGKNGDECVQREVADSRYQQSIRYLLYTETSKSHIFMYDLSDIHWHHRRTTIGVTISFSFISSG